MGDTVLEIQAQAEAESQINDKIQKKEHAANEPLPLPSQGLRECLDGAVAVACEV